MDKELEKQKMRERRHHKERMKRRARTVYPHYDQAYKLADHIRFCSCYVCKNGRYTGNSLKDLTRQERLSLLDEAEQMEEIDE